MRTGPLNVKPSRTANNDKSAEVVGEELGTTGNLLYFNNDERKQYVGRPHSLPNRKRRAGPATRALIGLIGLTLLLSGAPPQTQATQTDIRRRVH